MSTAGILRPGVVVFYHPLDNETEHNWQATALVNGLWCDSGSGPCPAVIRVPKGAFDVVVTDDGRPARPRIVEG